MLRQVSILPAGVQTWVRDVIGVSPCAGDHYYVAYASSLALYVYKAQSSTALEAAAVSGGLNPDGSAALGGNNNVNYVPGRNSVSSTTSRNPNQSGRTSKTFPGNRGTPNNAYQSPVLFRILSGHHKQITAVAWAPFDADLVATAGCDGRVCIWSVEAGAEVAILGEDWRAGGPVVSQLKWGPFANRDPAQQGETNMGQNTVPTTPINASLVLCYDNGNLQLWKPSLRCGPDGQVVVFSGDRPGQNVNPQGFDGGDPGGSSADGSMSMTISLRRVENRNVGSTHMIAYMNGPQMQPSKIAWLNHDELLVGTKSGSIYRMNSTSVNMNFSTAQPDSRPAMSGGISDTINKMNEYYSNFQGRPAMSGGINDTINKMNEYYSNFQGRPAMSGGINDTIAKINERTGAVNNSTLFDETGSGQRKILFQNEERTAHISAMYMICAMSNGALFLASTETFMGSGKSNTVEYQSPMKTPSKDMNTPGSNVKKSGGGSGFFSSFFSSSKSNVGNPSDSPGSERKNPFTPSKSKAGFYFESVLFEFEPQISCPVEEIAFLPHQAGNFITCSGPDDVPAMILANSPTRGTRGGYSSAVNREERNASDSNNSGSGGSNVILIWNVSQRAPLSKVRVPMGGAGNYFGGASILSMRLVDVSNVVDPNKDSGGQQLSGFGAGGGFGGGGGMPGVPPSGGSATGSKLFLSFDNGSVGLMDLQRRKIEFSTSAAHCETIFDVSIHPFNPNVFATASYDGFVKLWNLSKAESYHELPTDGSKLLYAVSFSPYGDMIACVNQVGVLTVWKLGEKGGSTSSSAPSGPFAANKKAGASVPEAHQTKATQILSLNVHNGASCLRLAWHPNNQWIATGGGDNIACVTDVKSKQIVKAYRHPGAAIGVAWGTNSGGNVDSGNTNSMGNNNTNQGNNNMGNTTMGNTNMFDNQGNQMDNSYNISYGGNGNSNNNFNNNMLNTPLVTNKNDHLLATACQDSFIRIFDTARDCFANNSSGDPILVLSGHTAKVFNITWHPHFPDILASGSDDKTIIIWSLNKRSKVRKLEGHMSYVRALCWHDAIPQILLSGSWDATIKVWDTVRGTCLYTAWEHHADVYGLRAHPERPFTFISSSRDTTLRVWSLEELGTPYLLKAALEGGNTGGPVRVNTNSGANNGSAVNLLEGMLPDPGLLQKESDALVKGRVFDPNNPGSGDEGFGRSNINNVSEGVNLTSFLTSYGKHVLYGSGFEKMVGDIRELADEIIRSAQQQEQMQSMTANSGQPPTAIQQNQMRSGVRTRRQLRLEIWKRIFSYFHYRRDIDDIWNLIGGVTCGGEVQRSVTALSSALSSAGNLGSGGNRRISTSSVNSTQSSAAAKNAEYLKKQYFGPPRLPNILHESEVLQDCISRALSLTTETGGISASRSGKREDRAVRAAYIMLLAGNIKGYCELMVKAGHWEQAIMAAPMVNIHFWQKLSADLLEKRGISVGGGFGRGGGMGGGAPMMAAGITSSSKAGPPQLFGDQNLPLLLITEHTEELIQTCLAQNRLADALVVAKAEAEGKYKFAGGSDASGNTNGPSSGNRDALYSVSHSLAWRQMEVSEPVSAACYHFAVNSVNKGLECLFRGGETLLYFVLCQIFGEAQETGEMGMGSDINNANSTQMSTLKDANSVLALNSYEKGRNHQDLEVSMLHATLIGDLVNKPSVSLAMELLAKAAVKHNLPGLGEQLLAGNVCGSSGNGGNSGGQSGNPTDSCFPQFTSVPMKLGCLLKSEMVAAKSNVNPNITHQSSSLSLQRSRQQVLETIGNLRRRMSAQDSQNMMLANPNSEISRWKRLMLTRRADYLSKYAVDIRDRMLANNHEEACDICLQACVEVIKEAATTTIESTSGGSSISSKDTVMTPGAGRGGGQGQGSNSPMLEQNNDGSNKVRGSRSRSKSPSSARTHSARNQMPWDLELLDTFLALIDSAPINTCNVKTIVGVLTISACCGFFHASVKGYVEILMALAQTVSNCQQASNTIGELFGGNNNAGNNNNSNSSEDGSGSLLAMVEQIFVIEAVFSTISFPDDLRRLTRIVRLREDENLCDCLMRAGCGGLVDLLDVHIKNLIAVHNTNERNGGTSTENFSRECFKGRFSDGGGSDTSDNSNANDYGSSQKLDLYNNSSYQVMGGFSPARKGELFPGQGTSNNSSSDANAAAQLLSRPLGGVEARRRLAHLPRYSSDYHWIFSIVPDTTWRSLMTQPACCLTGSLLPSGSVSSGSLVSVLSNKAIRGGAYKLEDGVNYVSLKEATLWSRVNVMSPLNTGFKIDAF